MSAAGSTPTPGPDLRVDFSHRVSDDERDAVVAALVVLASRRALMAASSPAAERPGGWARAARREGLRAWDPDDRW